MPPGSIVCEEVWLVGLAAFEDRQAAQCPVLVRISERCARKNGLYELLTGSDGLLDIFLVSVAVNVDAVGGRHREQQKKMKTNRRDMTAEALKPEDAPSNPGEGKYI